MAERTKVTPKKAKSSKSASKSTKKNPIAKFFSPLTGYLKGAWSELKQVRWPNRRATWGLTLAVIIFSAFLMGVITLLDSFFQFIFFEIILT